MKFFEFQTWLKFILSCVSKSPRLGDHFTGIWIKNKVDFKQTLINKKGIKKTYFRDNYPSNKYLYGIEPEKVKDQFFSTKIFNSVDFNVVF